MDDAACSDVNGKRSGVELEKEGVILSERSSWIRWLKGRNSHFGKSELITGSVIKATDQQRSGLIRISCISYIRQDVGCHGSNPIW